MHDRAIKGEVSMKVAIAALVLLTTTFAWSAENTSQSRFHLLSMKCEAENNEGPEIQPQSPPLDVDDPGTPGCNRWEINILTDGDFTRADRHLETPLLDLNYGVGDNIQLKYEVPMEQNHTNDRDETKVGRTRVGVKYLFFS